MIIHNLNRHNLNEDDLKSKCGYMQVAAESPATSQSCVCEVEKSCRLDWCNCKQMCKYAHKVVTPCHAIQVFGMQHRVRDDGHFCVTA